MKKGISIIICTYNGSYRLLEVLNNIEKLNALDFAVEVIIINNNSNDNTEKILNNYFEQKPFRFPFHIVFENRQGLVFAKICGLKNASFDYVIFCDDDNILDINYAVKCFTNFENNPQTGIMGGKGFPKSKIKLPEWFNQYKNAYAVGEQADKPGFLEYPKFFLWGAGMCVRKKAVDIEFLEKYSHLVCGRTGNKLLAGEDALFCISALQKGYKLYYDSDLQFYHIIEENRLKTDYLKNLLFGLGYSYSVLLKIYREIILKDKNSFTVITKDFIYLFYFFVKHLLNFNSFDRLKAHYFMGSMKGILKPIKL